jgi:hypothetical protein
MGLFERYRSKSTPSKLEVDFSRLGPPNLQLGLSSDQSEDARKSRRGEMFGAGVAAVTIQASLIVIASVTVYSSPIRSSMPSQPKTYSYPCYMAGSVLLSIEIGTCSYMVERNTVEYTWRVPTKDQEDVESGSSGSEESKKTKKTPRLVCLLKNQEVSDQKFLAKAKQQIVTSSRLKDTRPLEEFQLSKKTNCISSKVKQQASLSLLEYSTALMLTQS